MPPRPAPASAGRALGAASEAALPPGLVLPLVDHGQHRDAVTFFDAVVDDVWKPAGDVEVNVVADERELQGRGLTSSRARPRTRPGTGHRDPGRSRRTRPGPVPVPLRRAGR